MRSLLEISRAAVLQKFYKNDQKVQEDLRILREWLVTQPHLPPIDDVRLEKFLANCKFSLEVTKGTIDIYYTMRSYLRDFFGNMDPLDPALQTALRVASAFPLKTPTENCERVIFSKIWDSNVDQFSLVNHVKCVIMIEELRNRYDYEYGNHYIIDMAQVKLGHLIQVTPDLMIKLAKFYVKGYKNRFSGIHIVNPPSFVDVFLRVLKLSFSEKIYNRIILHKTLGSLHKRIPKEILPSDLGGNLPSSLELMEDWIKELEVNRDWFLAQQNIVVDESKRPDKLQEGLFGSIHGSFRKLDVD